jgi:hypothetical protein
MSGKGDTPRPFAVKAEVYANNYCLTFGHKLKDGRCKNCGEAKPEGSLEGLTDGKAADL